MHASKSLHTSCTEIEHNCLWRDPTNVPQTFVSHPAWESAQMYSLKVIHGLLIEAEDSRVLIKCLWQSEHQVQLQATALQAFSPATATLTPPEECISAFGGGFEVAATVHTCSAYKTDAHLQAHRATIAPEPSQSDVPFQKQTGAL